MSEFKKNDNQKPRFSLLPPKILHETVEPKCCEGREWMLISKDKATTEEWQKALAELNIGDIIQTQHNQYERVVEEIIDRDCVPPMPFSIKTTNGEHLPESWINIIYTKSLSLVT